MIDQMLDAALAPFASQVGWQGFAYGLLGIETVKRSIKAAVRIRGETNDDDT